MTSEIFSVHDKYELLALHRGLMEARFCDVANDPDVSGSPILAKIHREIVSALMALDKPVGGSREQWQEWLIIRADRREWSVALARAAESAWWPRLDGVEKIKAARDLLSPFVLSDQQAEAFVELVDSRSTRS